MTVKFINSLLTDGKGGFLMPDLIDVHCHLWQRLNSMNTGNS